MKIWLTLFEKWKVKWKYGSLFSRMKNEMKMPSNRDREWKVNWKCFEFEIKKWNFSRILEKFLKTQYLEYPIPLDSWKQKKTQENINTQSAFQRFPSFFSFVSKHVTHLGSWFWKQFLTKITIFLKMAPLRWWFGKRFSTPITMPVISLFFLEKNEWNLNCFHFFFEKWKVNFFPFHSFLEMKSEIILGFTLFEKWKWNWNASRSKGEMWEKILENSRETKLSQVILPLPDFKKLTEYILC